MTDLAEKMSALVLEFEQSGQSQKDFSASKGMGFHKFNYWYRKLRSEGKVPLSASGFIEVRKEYAANALPLELIYPNGVRVIVAPDNLGVVSALIKLY
jgi:hypothetical protein